jgi:hypothetical protein
MGTYQQARGIDRQSQSMHRAAYSRKRNSEAGVDDLTAIVYAA